jgi:hypothetical protein
VSPVRIAMRPKLARSCWSDTMLEKSLRKTETERQARGAAQGSLLSASPQQEYPPGHQRLTVTPLSKLLLVWCSFILTLVQERCPFMVARNVTGQCREFLPLWAKELAHEAEA